jgi:hypothetical protein
VRCDPDFSGCPGTVRHGVIADLQDVTGAEFVVDGGYTAG